MKKILLFGMFVFLSIPLSAQTLLGGDNAGNYTTWSNGSNNGSYLTAWDMWTSGDGSKGYYLGDAAGQGFGNINTSSKSFGMYANSGTAEDVPETFAQRFVSGTGSPENTGRAYLLPGMSIKITVAVAYRNGQKGIRFKDQSFGDLFLFDVTSDQYRANSSDLGWTYSETSIFVITVEQINTTQYRVNITRDTDVYNSGNLTGVVSGFLAFISDTNQGSDLNNLYFNSIETYNGSHVELSTDLAAFKGFRMLASPVSTTASDLLSEIWTQGQTSGGDVTNGVSNVWNWNSALAGNDENDWVKITDIGTTTLSGAAGILVYDYDNDDFADGQDNAITTLSVTGSEKSAPGPVSVNENANGWALLGNPFASSIDWSAVALSNVNATAKIWNPTANDAGSWTDVTGSYKIAAFQGFMVQTTAAGAATVTIDAADKSTGATFLGKIASINEIKFDLSSGDSFTKSIRLQINNASSISRDRFDSERFAPLAINYLDAYFAVNDLAFSINSIPELQTQTIIPMYVELTESGLITLNTSNFNIPAGYSATLVDHVADKEMTIEQGFTYQFEHVVANKAVTKTYEDVLKGAMTLGVTSSNRFSVVIGPMTTSITELSELPISLKLNQNYPNPFNPSTQISFELPSSMDVNLSVFDMLGREVANLVNGTAKAGLNTVNFNASNLSSGMYFYRLNAGNSVITKKMSLIK